jgi:hypothetical protein
VVGASAIFRGAPLLFVVVATENNLLGYVLVAPPPSCSTRWPAWSYEYVLVPVPATPIRKLL